MTIDCSCNVLSTTDFGRAVDAHAEKLRVMPDSLRRDAALVFRTARNEKAAEGGNTCGDGKKCCGGCLPTIEKIIQERGFHRGEPLDGPENFEDIDECPFEARPAILIPA